MGSRRYLVILLALVGLGLLAYGLFGTSDSAPSPSSRSNSTDVSGDTEALQHQVEDFQLTLTVSPNEIWHLSAPRADRRPGEVHLTSPAVALEQDGETTVTLTSKTGVYRFDDRYLEMNGDVVVRRLPRNQTLRTNVLGWSLSSGILKTDARVRLETAEGTLTARGLWANFSEERLKFLSEVQYLSHSSSG